jgi:hypothetical protein
MRCAPHGRYLQHSVESPSYFSPSTSTAAARELRKAGKADSVVEIKSKADIAITIQKPLDELSSSEMADMKKGVANIIYNQLTQNSDGTLKMLNTT